MTLQEYKELTKAIIHMSLEFEGIYSEPTEENKKICAYVQYIVDCVNDVPARTLDYIKKAKKFKYPEVEEFDEDFAE